MRKKVVKAEQVQVSSISAAEIAAMTNINQIVELNTPSPTWNGKSGILLEYSGDTAVVAVDVKESDRINTLRLRLPALCVYRNGKSIVKEN